MDGGGHHMTYVRKKGRRFWLPAALSILAAALVATVWVTVAAGRSSKSTASTIKIAILSDCQGAFASNYEQDIGGAITALAQYAGVKPKNPNKTFVNGTAGAWDTTAAVKAPNFFRFNGDGIQWNAGIGDLAYKKLHWRKA